MLTCSICKHPITTGSYVGTGDGTGQSFAHKDCYDHAAAVARLVEAAKLFLDGSVCYCFEVSDKPCGHCRTEEALSALPAPVSAEPAKGVRCWRRPGGCELQYDRIRQRGDGFEWVLKDGTTSECTIEFVPGEPGVDGVVFVECHDAPYVAPPVAAPSPAMPEPAAMESAEAFVIRLNYTQGPADKAKLLESRDAAWQARLDAARTDWNKEVLRQKETIKAKDAEIARLTGERDDKTVDRVSATKMAQLAALVLPRHTGGTSHEIIDAACARLSAAGGVDQELLETARRLAVGMMGCPHLRLKSGNPATVLNVVQDAAESARTLHAALTAPGEVGR